MSLNNIQKCLKTMPLHKKLLWSLGEAILLVFCIMVYKHDEIIFFTKSFSIYFWTSVSTLK